MNEQEARNKISDVHKHLMECLQLTRVKASPFIEKAIRDAANVIEQILLNV